MGDGDAAAGVHGVGPVSYTHLDVYKRQDDTVGKDHLFHPVCAPARHTGDGEQRGVQILSLIHI